MIKTVGVYDGEIICSTTPEGDFIDIKPFDWQDLRYDINNKVIKETKDEFIFSIRGSSSDDNDYYFEYIHSFKIEGNDLIYTAPSPLDEYSLSGTYKLSQGPPWEEGVCYIDYFGPY